MTYSKRRGDAHARGEALALQFCDMIALSGNFHERRVSPRIDLRPSSFLAGYHIFLRARCIWVSKIRCILIGLIEHFPSATRIAAVFLDQLRD